MSTTAFDFEVTDSDVDEYWERGYWISPKILSDDEIDRLRTEIERLKRGEKDTDSWGWSGPIKMDADRKSMFQIVGAWWVNDTLRASILSPKIGYIGSRLMKCEEIRLIHDQVLVKPGLGEEGLRSQEGNFGWHQDFSYWDWINTDNLCTCWVALQDTELSNGAMRTIVGSHKWGYNPDSNTAFEKDLDGLREKFGKADAEWIDEPCVLKAGQASFHQALTFHGSGPNSTDQPRMSFVSHLMPGGSRYNKNGKWNRMLSLMGPNLQNGDEFGDPCFPQLWPT